MQKQKTGRDRRRDHDRGVEQRRSDWLALERGGDQFIFRPVRTLPLPSRDARRLEATEQQIAEALNGYDKAEAEYHDQELDLWYEDGVGRDAQVRTLDEPFRCTRFTPAEHRWLEDRVSVPYCVGPRPEPKPRPSPGYIHYVGKK